MSRAHHREHAQPDQRARAGLPDRQLPPEPVHGDHAQVAARRHGRGDQGDRPLPRGGRRPAGRPYHGLERLRPGGEVGGDIRGREHLARGGRLDISRDSRYALLGLGARVRFPLRMHLTGRSIVALISGLLMVAGCFTITVAAFPSPADACQGAPHPESRCDGSSHSFGHGTLALPADRVKIPAPAPAGTLPFQPHPVRPHHWVQGSDTPRAPPLSY